MTKSTTPATNGGTIIESVIANGDLDRLGPAERTRYYGEVCHSLGLNPLTQPFAYIRLNNKLTLYALRGATDQLRTLRGVSVEEMTESERGDVYIVTCKVRDASGRTDMAKGAVPIANLKGEALANAVMKAETKAKRRATLSICGLGMLDETELETIPASVKQAVEPQAAKPQPLPDAHLALLQGAANLRQKTDPINELIGPYTIPVSETAAGNNDWITWGRELSSALKEVAARDEGEAWLTANAAALNDCQAEHPGVYKRLGELAMQMRERLPDFLDAEEVEDHQPAQCGQRDGDARHCNALSPIAGRHPVPAVGRIEQVAAEHGGSHGFRSRHPKLGRGVRLRPCPYSVVCNMTSATVVMRRVGGGLFAAEAKASDLLRKIPAGSWVAVRIMRSRSARQSAYYWRVLEEVVAATGRWRTPEELHNALKVATGHVTLVRLIDGRLVKVPESTSFDSMSQDEAQAYYDAAFRVISDEVLDGMPIEDLLAPTVGHAA